jgi:hypothetical protein
VFPMSVQEFYRRYLSETSDFWYRTCKACECTGMWPLAGVLVTVWS